MSERSATAEIATTEEPTAQPLTTGSAQEPELATADLLVEEVSIDGMCGVY